MAAEQSAGLLVYRTAGRNIEFLLAHPGGPFWAKKDWTSWSIPKGLFEPDEPALEAAKREFREETNLHVEGDFVPLSSCKQPSGKIIHPWLIEANLDLSDFKSNEFEMEWPKGSGKMASFPEVDKIEYMGLDLALKKILKGQQPIIMDALKTLGLDANELLSPDQGSLF
jgi:predicted NUDIX family NTP pyrophosphohydrolase